MNSRGLRHLLAALVLLALAGSGLGQDDGEVEIRPSQIKKGRDFAPREQIVSVRNPGDYRRSEGILAQAGHAPVLVEVDSLRRRRLDMYAGTTYTESLTGRMPTAPRTVLPVVSQAAPERSRGWGTALAIAVPMLMFVGCLVWWRRQMKYASAFSTQLLELRQRRHAQARRERRRSHIKLVPRRR